MRRGETQSEEGGDTYPCTYTNTYPHTHPHPHLHTAMHVDLQTLARAQAHTEVIGADALAHIHVRQLCITPKHPPKRLRRTAPRR